MTTCQTRSAVAPGAKRVRPDELAGAQVYGGDRLDRPVRRSSTKISPRLVGCTMAGTGPPGHVSGKALEITSGIALWYRPGTPVLPVRWVLVCDPDEKRDPQAFFSTDITIEPADIIALYVRRWLCFAT